MAAKKSGNSGSKPKGRVHPNVPKAGYTKSIRKYESGGKLKTK